MNKRKAESSSEGQGPPEKKKDTVKLERTWRDENDERLITRLALGLLDPDSTLHALTKDRYYEPRVLNIVKEFLCPEAYILDDSKYFHAVATAVHDASRRLFVLDYGYTISYEANKPPSSERRAGTGIHVFSADGRKNYNKTYGTSGREKDLEFYRPQDLMIHDDHLYVADTGNRRIQVLTLDGEFVRKFRTDQKGLAGFAPWGLAGDPVTKNFFACDAVMGQAALFSPAGHIVRTLDTHDVKLDASMHMLLNMPTMALQRIFEVTMSTIISPSGGCYINGEWHIANGGESFVFVLDATTFEFRRLYAHNNASTTRVVSAQDDTHVIIIDCRESLMRRYRARDGHTHPEHWPRRVSEGRFRVRNACCSAETGTIYAIVGRRVFLCRGVFASQDVYML